MGSAAPAYRYSEPARKRNTTPLRKNRSSKSRSDVFAIPGKKLYSTKSNSVKEQKKLTVTQSFDVLIAVIIGLMLVVGCICFARIWLTNQTVELTRATAALSTDISEARNAGNQLEVQQSSLGGMVTVQEKAAALGMSKPEEVTIITLGPDVVSTDDNGNLSLGKSALITEGLG